MNADSNLTPTAVAQLEAPEGSCPPLAAALSPLGRRVWFPQDIPVQSAQAAGKRLNGTIGQITDGRGSAMPFPAMAEALGGLGAPELNKALLYSPVQGIAEVRAAWRRWQRREVAEEIPSSLPLVTVGLTHGLSLVADLFGGPGRAVVVPAPYWGNYREAFGVRTGARIVETPFWVDGIFNCTTIGDALADLPAGEPAIAILNLPSNPGGYSLTARERRLVHEDLVAAAEARPLIVLCDDAYAGLVYDPEIPRSSMFWDLVGAHPNLLPIKVDGATKELNFFGGRVGFLTFPFAPGTAPAEVMEDKVKGLVRATLGSPVAASQMLVLAALRDDRLAGGIEGLRQLLGARARTLGVALEGVDHQLLRPLPFNSGCFALIKLAPGLGLSAEQVRRHLLDHEDTGVVSIAPDYLRIAFCSVEEASLPELVQRLERGVRELAGRR